MCKVVEVKGEIFTDPEDLLFVMRSDKTVNRELVRRFREFVYEPRQHISGTTLMYVLDKDNMKINVIILQTNTPEEGTHRITVAEI